MSFLLLSRSVGAAPVMRKGLVLQVLKKAAFLFQALDAGGTSACRPWPSSALRKGSCSKGLKTFHRYPGLDLREVSLKSPCSSLLSFRGPCSPKPGVPHFRQKPLRNGGKQCLFLNGSQAFYHPWLNLLYLLGTQPHSFEQGWRGGSGQRALEIPF